VCQNKFAEHKTIQYRYFKKFNESNFQRDLANSNIDKIETIADPNISLNMLYNVLNHILSFHAPIKERRIKRDHQPEWFTDEFKSLMHKRDNCHRKGDIDQYKILRNRVTYLIKKNKKDYFNRAVNKSKDPKYLWKHLKDISFSCKANKLVLPQRISIDETVVEGENNIINELNKHFVNISNIITKTKFTNENFLRLKEVLNEKLRFQEFDVKYITPLEVKHIIDKLDINKSTGLDGIGPNILKQCGDLITPCIASIINNSIWSGMFPDMLKAARVIPIYKSGDKDDPGNYRPISILPTISKIYERHIANQIQNYFSNTNILHSTQSGFRKNHSCNTALVKLIDTWLKYIDEGRVIGTVFLDLKKAFDLVDHQILLYKLRLYHFSEKSLKLFSSYLSDRSQLVKLGNTQSEALPVVSGVPQGSILGPLLFLVYINDISFQSQDLNIDLYADDSTMYESGYQLSEVQNKLQNNINYIVDWCKINNMSLNPIKTTCMIIGSSNKLKQTSNLFLTMNDQIVSNVLTQKILGIYVDNTLSWQPQIDYVCKRINNRISLLKHILYYLTDNMKIMFYNAYILPIIDYCCVVWGQTNIKYVNRIFGMQKRIARIILNKPKMTPSNILFRELQWLPFIDRCHYHIALLVYKTCNNMAPIYMNNVLKFSENESHNLRSESNKQLSLQIIPKTKYSKKSFTYISYRVWNSIPFSIKNAKSVSSFKYKYKTFLLNQQ